MSRFFVCLAAHIPNGWKIPIRPGNGKNTTKNKGVPFTAMAL